MFWLTTHNNMAGKFKVNVNITCKRHGNQSESRKRRAPPFWNTRKHINGKLIKIVQYSFMCLAENLNDNRDRQEFISSINGSITGWRETGFSKDHNNRWCNQIVVFFCTRFQWRRSGENDQLTEDKLTGHILKETAVLFQCSSWVVKMMSLITSSGDISWGEHRLWDARLVALFTVVHGKPKSSVWETLVGNRHKDACSLQAKS